MEAITKQELVELSALAQKYLKLQAEILEIQTNLSQKIEALRCVSEVDIPATMAQIGMLTFTLTDGYKIEVKPDVAVSISADNKGQAFGWLRKHGFGDIIKEKFEFNFGKGQEKEVKAFKVLLSSQGFKNFEETESVHASTLKAFVKERMEAGTDVPPYDIFGIYPYKKTTIKQGGKK